MSGEPHTPKVSVAIFLDFFSFVFFFFSYLIFVRIIVFLRQPKTKSVASAVSPSQPMPLPNFKRFLVDDPPRYKEYVERVDFCVLAVQTEPFSSKRFFFFFDFFFDFFFFSL
jgi:hypothetical protein